MGLQCQTPLRFLIESHFRSKIFLGPKNFLGQEKNWAQKILGSKKNQVQNYLISCGSLSLKFHAILLAKSGVMGFVSVVESREQSRVEQRVVVLLKINEMALKVPSQFNVKTKLQFLLFKRQIYIQVGDGGFLCLTYLGPMPYIEVLF